MGTHGNRLLFVEAPSFHPHCSAEVVISDTPAGTGDVAVPESTGLRYKHSTSGSTLGKQEEAGPA